MREREGAPARRRFRSMHQLYVRRPRILSSTTRRDAGRAPARNAIVVMRRTPGRPASPRSARTLFPRLFVLQCCVVPQPNAGPEHHSTILPYDSCRRGREVRADPDLAAFRIRGPRCSSTTRRGDGQGPRRVRLHHPAYNSGRRARMYKAPEASANFADRASPLQYRPQRAAFLEHLAEEDRGSWRRPA